MTMCRSRFTWYVMWDCPHASGKLPTNAHRLPRKLAHILVVLWFILVIFTYFGVVKICLLPFFNVASLKLDQAPVPLSIFRSNSKFDENSKHSSVKYTRPITTIFCTRHDSVTVVTCAKYRCDRSGIFKTRAFWIFIEFRIRSKYA